MEEKKFKVYRAGAGSGKTFQLIKEILALALSQPNHDYYRHILAITFTNAAAFEMRHRFLHALQYFSNEPIERLNKDALFDQVKIQTRQSDQELKLRAANVYRHVLHHYDLLSIGTIDNW
jgi:ATP-dependent helicase/nuclease subunit A